MPDGAMNATEQRRRNGNAVPDERSRMLFRQRLHLLAVTEMECSCLYVVLLFRAVYAVPPARACGSSAATKVRQTGAVGVAKRRYRR